MIQIQIKVMRLTKKNTVIEDKDENEILNKSPESLNEKRCKR
jgi:hypothetical protein